MEMSEMDVSHTLNGSPGHAAGVDGVLGYQGWAARRLILACHRIFVEHGGGVQTGRNTDLVSESLEHRGMIYWCLSNINADVISASAAQTEADLEDEDIFHDGLTDFYHVWTLAEAFLLDSAPLPAAPLLRWLKMYCQSGEDEEKRWELDEAERVAIEADAAGSSANADSDVYWDALRSLVVGVSPRRAAVMLRSHPEGRDNAGEVCALARQLEKMPLLLPERADGEDVASGGGTGGAEDYLDREGFFATWTRWQKSCKAAAARFGVDAVVDGERSGGGGGDSEQQRHLRWLWGALCGQRSCLVEATESWSGLFAAVLAFEKPGTRKEEVAPLMRECLRTYSEGARESFLTRVIRDASAGAVDSILKFAHEHGETLALSACATHLVDLLSRAEATSVTNQQRSWFFRRLAGHLKAFPCGGWELAATYLRDGRDNNEEGGQDEARLLTDLARGVAPKSERAAHELVGWCRANSLGEETAAAVARARAAAWIEQTGFSAAAMGLANGGREEEIGDGVFVRGACGKAAYWLAKAGGGVQLERLCAEVSERLIVGLSPRPGGAASVEAQQAVLAEADGVLAAIPPGIAGPELSFLESYKEIADVLSIGGKTKLAGALAVNMLAPLDAYAEGPAAGHAALPTPTPPPRSWAHLLRLAVPTLEATAAAAFEGAGAPVSMDDEEGGVTVTVAQVHALLAKLQALVASENRVGSVCGVGRRSRSRSTLASAPAPYGFGDDEAGGPEKVVSKIRRALASCLGAAMMSQNAQEAAPSGAAGGRRQELTAGRRSEMLLLGNKRLPAEALIAPRVAV